MLPTVTACSLRLHCLRLRPGQDLRAGIDDFARAQGIDAGYVATCVGSLTHARLRLASAERSESFAGKFEIVSLCGTVSAGGGSHLHIAIADVDGKVWGGHLLEGSQVYTTAEIVLGEIAGVKFVREHDEQTGYNELQFTAK